MRTASPALTQASMNSRLLFGAEIFDTSAPEKK
jgi:hypothetical protein